MKNKKDGKIFFRIAAVAIAVLMLLLMVVSSLFQ
jgi:hypothetical protein